MGQIDYIDKHAIEVTKTAVELVAPATKVTPTRHDPAVLALHATRPQDLLTVISSDVLRLRRQRASHARGP